jgi:hypothetical protein
MTRFQAFALTLSILAATSITSAQRPDIKLAPSPKGAAEIQVLGKYDEKGRYNGGQWITIDYSRPIMRGRANLFGSGADYGKKVNPDSTVWRAGANDTTRLTTQASLTFGTTTIKPGTYNVFVDLKEGAWTLILTTQGVQPKYDPNDKVLLYGSYNYDPKFDVLRVPMQVQPLPMSIEQLTIGFSDVRTDGGSLFITWDRTMASVNFTAK